MTKSSKLAVIYHYYEKDDTYRENFVFFLARAWRPEIEFFIVISGDHSIILPTYANVHYVYTENLGHDFGSYAAATESGALDGFDRLIFVNCSVRGPFLPHYSTGCWTTPFLSLLKGDVHLCGSAINILHDTRPTHALYRQRHPEDPEPFSHVQSAAHAMTAECFAFLRAQGLYTAARKLDKESAVAECEVGMSMLVRGHGWNLACLLPPYNSLDYRLPHSEINPATTTGHPQRRGAYFGLSPHPFELIFIKTGWNLLSSEARDFHSLMALQHHPVSTLDWAEARVLRNRLAKRLEGALAARPIETRQEPDPAEAISSAVTSAPRQRCIIVLGMHRSGTSALAGLLVQLGAEPPRSLMEPHFSNPKGFFESVRVRDFNDALLAMAGSNWKDWRPLSHEWFASRQVQDLHAEASALLDEEYGTSEIIVLKDPRICRLLPFWRSVMEKRRTTLLPLHIHRPPQEVAASLTDRYRFHPAFTHLLWLRHVLDAEAGSRGLTRHFISYDQLLDDGATLARQIAGRFDLPPPDDAAKQHIEEFLSPDLRHHRASSMAKGNILAPWYHECFEIFDGWAYLGQNSSEQARLDTIRTELGLAAPIFQSIITELQSAPGKSA